MSSVAIMREVLIAHAPLTALVPAARIIAGIIPQDTTLPAISIREVGSREVDTIARDAGNATNVARVQVTVIALSVESQKAIMAAAKLGRGLHRGTAAGFVVLGVQQGGVGPDMNNLDDDAIYEQSRDFLVTFIEPN